MRNLTIKRAKSVVACLAKVKVYIEDSFADDLEINGVRCRKLGDLKNGEEKTIPADSVILSVGYTPAPIAEKAKHIHVIGDAARVGNLRTVIWGAWDVCMKL